MLRPGSVQKSKSQKLRGYVKQLRVCIPGTNNKVIQLAAKTSPTQIENLIWQWEIKVGTGPDEQISQRQTSQRAGQVSLLARRQKD